MNADNIAKLENSIKLKRNIFSKGIWKNYSFVPPSLVLFVGILGLIYLYRTDYLWTYYSIPFVVIFALGAIWFKATKKYLVNKRIAETKVFLVCLCIPLTKIGDRYVFLFSTGKNRNNIYYLEKERKNLLEIYDNTSFFKGNNNVIKVDDSDICLTTLRPSKMNTSKNNTLEGKKYWLVYSGENVKFISLSDIAKYS